jgi:hypothetical protein
VTAPTQNPSKDVYFASFEEREFGSKILAKVEQTDNDEVTSELRSKLSLATKYYYGFDLSGIHGTSSISRGGEEGELAVYRVNHARALAQTLLNLVISQRVVWVPKATNVDYESLKQVEVAKAVLEYYWAERRVEVYASRMVEAAIYLTEGFVLGLWDETAGEEVPGEMDPESDPENPKPVRSGDFRFENVSTHDVIRDPRKHSWDQLDWVIIRVWRNKYDLLAQYPEYAKEIVSAPVESQSDRKSGSKQTDSDDVPVLLFFHKPTPALPYGREAWVLGDKTVLKDGTLSYDEIPLFRVSPSEMTGTPYGYSQFLEILAIQELVDSLQSTAATNLTTFGTQNIFLPSQAEIQPVQLGGAMRVIQGGPDGKEPKALELCRTPPELYTHLKELKTDMESLFGLNATVRGQVQNDKLSGAAMALLETQAKQQSSGLHGSFRNAVQALGQFVIAESRKRCVTERKVSLVGKENAFLVSEAKYDKDSFGSIKRVLIDIGNPLSQNVFGRAEQAKELLQMGLVSNLEQYFMLLDSGRTEPITQGLTHELLLIKSENEDISNGVCPEVMLQDNALLHGREHRMPVASPQARKNPAVLKAHTEHMHKHYEAYYGTPPMIPSVDPMTGMPAADPMTGEPVLVPEPMYRQRMLILMGMAPPQDPGMGMPPPGGGGGDPNAGGMQGGGAPPIPQQDPGQNTPAPSGAEPVAGLPPKKPSDLPSMPTDPSTGQKWRPGSGEV